MKRILLTGVAGQLGHELNQLLSQNWTVISVTRKELNLQDEEQIRKVVQETRPDLILNPAAYTQVDKAEEETETAFAINTHAPQILAEEAKKMGIPLIHFSTDFVFSGNQEAAYLESDSAQPLSVYGKSKWLGEQAIQKVDGDYLIFRLAWVYSNVGKNFFKTISRLALERESLSVVHDQIGTPTPTTYIAERVVEIVKQLLHHQVEFSEVKGVYHLTCGGQGSWFDFAQKIAAVENPACIVSPITSAEYPTTAPRPKSSILDNQKLNHTFGLKSISWESSFEEFLRKNINPS